VVATVSHQHIYGALFRILWPLAAGRPFSSRTYLHGSEVASRLAEGPSILVSSPVQLRVMADAEALTGLSPAAIFSSGAPLDDRTAREVAAATTTSVTEVFGSTETGGVAWRRRPQGGEVAWQPFPGVAVECDDGGRLSVTSRLVSVGEDAGGGCRRFCMGDRVEIASDGRFHLRGRVDRVVKIGSKRLSLPDMEAEIGGHPWVTEAALVVLRRGLEPRVCAAVVLSEIGLAEHAERGRVETGRALAAALSAYFDRVLLPRVWRFVDHLPRTPQGKLPEAQVQALFAPETGGPLDPVVETEEVDGLCVRRTCVVPEDLAFFAGHFDGFPIVPGVAQLRWVIDASQCLAGESLRIQAIDALKFHQPLLPGARFEIEVVADADGNRLRFRLWRDEGEVSSGRLVLARS
jgi:acyl-coenzyme A synthetase/AMP-(fatty) acid ligase